MHALQWGSMGAACGIVSAITSWHWEAMFYMPGLVFGLLVIAHLYRATGATIARMLGGACASVFAYSIAVGGLLFLGAMADSAAWAILSVAIVGGGGAILLDVLIRPLEAFRVSPKRLAAAALVGAAAVAVPAAAKESLDYQVWFFATFIAWQTGIGAVLGAFDPIPTSPLLQNHAIHLPAEPALTRLAG